MTEQYESEAVRFVREFPILKKSLEEIIEISNAPDDFKNKIRAAVAAFDAGLDNAANREREPYDQARTLLSTFLAADPGIISKEKEHTEEYALFVGLRSTIWETVYKINGLTWPPQKN